MNGVSFQSVLTLLGVAVALLALSRRLRLPPVLAYLCAGILVGPDGLGWIADSPTWHTLGQFGLVFLMFTIGLEFSWPRLAVMKRLVFGLGGAQLLICGTAFGLAAWYLGAAVPGALVIGAILAMSSTAIVMTLLFAQLEQHTRHGRHAIAVLLFQDLAVVPLLILIPTLAGETSASVGTLAAVALESVLVLVAMFLVGRWGLAPLFHRVALTRQREYFMLTVLLLTLAAAWIAQAAGLSLALGAFLAGMTLGETDYRHQVEADVLPFRDLLLGVFFVTVGMSFDLDTLRAHWALIGAGAVAVLLFKTLVVLGLCRRFGLETGSALRTGLVLSQVGEFGFALLLQARDFNVLTPALAQIVLAVIVLTMCVAPVIVWTNGRMARRLVPGYGSAPESDIQAIREQAHADHVIICGYGRSGQNLAWMLEQEHVASIALDLDPDRVQQARAAGRPVIYGDAARRDVLAAAGLAHARALAVSFNDEPVALKILEIARNVKPSIPVLVRTKDDTQLDELRQAGATEVVPEALEGSLMIGVHLLLLLGAPPERVQRLVDDVRRDRYRMLRGFFHGRASIGRLSYRRRLHTVTLAAGAHAIDRRLDELDLDRLGVSVKTLRRHGREHRPPAPDFRLSVDDVLVLDGTPDALHRAEDVLLK